MSSFVNAIVNGSVPGTTYQPAKYLTGTELPTNIVDSSIQSLGPQSEDLDLNHNGVVNVRDVTLSANSPGIQFQHIGSGNTASITFPSTPAANRTYTLPDNDLTFNAAADLSGTTLPGAIVNSSLKNLGVQDTNMDLGGNDILGVGSLKYSGTPQYANNGYTLDWAHVALTAGRTIYVPDKTLELNKAEDLYGTTINSNIANSSIANLGTQDADLDMGGFNITNVGTFSGLHERESLNMIMRVPATIYESTTVLTAQWWMYARPTTAHLDLKYNISGLTYSRNRNSIGAILANGAYTILDPASGIYQAPTWGTDFLIPTPGNLGPKATLSAVTTWDSNSFVYLTLDSLLPAADHYFAAGVIWINLYAIPYFRNNPTEVRGLWLLSVHSDDDCRITVNGETFIRTYVGDRDNHLVFPNVDYYIPIQFSFFEVGADEHLRIAVTRVQTEGLALPSS